MSLEKNIDFITASDFINLKNKVNEELERRCEQGDVSMYSMNYTDPPLPGEQISISHINEIIDPMNKVNASQVNLALKEKQISYITAEELNNLNNLVDTWKKSPMKARDKNHNCAGSCTGLCYTGCSGSCIGSCKGSCASYSPPAPDTGGGSGGGESSGNCNGYCTGTCTGYCGHCGGCGGGCDTTSTSCYNCEGTCVGGNS